MADDRSTQIPEIIVTPQDGPSPQHSTVTPWRTATPYAESQVERHYREQKGQVREDEYWDRLLAGSGIPEDWVIEMLDSGYSPKQILELWDTRTPAQRWINLGPDPVDLSSNFPDASFQTDAPVEPGQPIEEVVVREKIITPPLIVRIFPKPIQMIADTALMAYDLYQSLPEPVRNEFEREVKEAFEAAWKEIDDSLISDLRIWMGFESLPDLGKRTYEYPPDGRVVESDTPLSSNRDFEFDIPAEQIPLGRPTKPPVPKKIPDPLRPENWMPDPEPWPDWIPEELPPITIELKVPEFTQPAWKDTPLRVWKTGPKPVVKVRFKGRMRTPARTKPDEGNRLRGPNEKKGQSHAAGMALRGLYKFINKTYGEYDEFMDLKDILLANIWLDEDGNLVVDWLQLGFDLIMNDLQDRAIGKMSGYHREMIQEQGWWINPAFGDPINMP